MNENMKRYLKRYLGKRKLYEDDNGIEIDGERYYVLSIGIDIDRFHRNIQLSPDEIYNNLLRHWELNLKILESGSDKIDIRANSCAFCNRYRISRCHECPYRIITGNRCYDDEEPYAQVKYNIEYYNDIKAATMAAAELVMWIKHNENEIKKIMKERGY